MRVLFFFNALGLENEFNFCYARGILISNLSKNIGPTPLTLSGNCTIKQEPKDSKIKNHQKKKKKKKTKTTTNESRTSICD